VKFLNDCSKKIAVIGTILVLGSSISYAKEKKEQIKKNVIDNNNARIMLSELAAVPLSSVKIDNVMPVKEMGGNWYFINAKINNNIVTLITDGKTFLPQALQLEDESGYKQIRDIVTKYRDTYVKYNVEVSESDLIFGKKDAPIKVIVFSDFECPFCKNAYRDTKNIFRDYEDVIGIYYLHFPLDFHPKAQLLASIFEFMKGKGKIAMELYDIDTKNKSDDDIIAEAVEKFKLDNATALELKDAINNKKYLAKIKSDISKGMDIGVGGTPAFVVNGRMVMGANVPALKKAIEEEAKKLKIKRG
jgi:protein-disulfide isomerase